MAVPTVALTVHQQGTTQPYQPVLVTCGMSRYVVTLGANWTQSTANSNEYYYTGGTASLSSNTMFKVRGSENRVKFREGTLGSLPTYGCAFGDNDTLGYDTLYVRLGDSAAPADADIVTVIWDETLAGDSNRDAACTVEWWFDLTDGPTATAIAGWDSAFRYVTDHRDGTTQIDRAGSVPTGLHGSSMKGWSYMACLPAGTMDLYCRVTNGSGEQTTESVTITVASDTRTQISVGGGGDYATLEAAVTAGIPENAQVNILNGHSETISGAPIIAADGIRITTSGSASFQIDSVLRLDGDGCLIDGDISFSSSLTNQAAVRLLRNHRFALVGVTITGTSSARLDGVLNISNFNQTPTMVGFLIQNITADIYGAYLVTGNVNLGGLQDLHIIGNDLSGDLTIFADGPSTNESTIRDVVRTDSQTILYNHIREMTKDGLRISEARHSYVAHNRFQNGVIRPGESGGAGDKCYETRIEGNLIERDAGTSGLASLSLNAGVDGLYAVSNVIVEGDAGTSVMVSGASQPGVNTTYYAGYREHRDVYIIHNTCSKTAGAQDTMRGAGSADATYVTNWNIIANHVLEHASYSGSGIVAYAATVTDNTEETGSLDADLVASVAPLAHATEPGAYYDYYNQVRNGTSFRGATGTGVLAGLVMDGISNGGDYTFGEVEGSTTPLSGYVDLINLDDANSKTVGTVVVTGDVTLTADPSDEVIPASGGFRVWFEMERLTADDLLGQVTIPVAGQADLVFTVSATVTSDAPVVSTGGRSRDRSRDR